MSNDDSKELSQSSQSDHTDSSDVAVTSTTSNSSLNTTTSFSTSSVVGRSVCLNDTRRVNSTSSSSPNIRELSATESSQLTVSTMGRLRVMQWNMLADGLSGLQKDLGAFSRIQKGDIDWDESRKYSLLYELLQYDPDVITLQECDHYYDWFLPCLTGECIVSVASLLVYYVIHLLMD